MESLQKTIYRQLNLELSKKPEEQEKRYIITLASEIRLNNMHLSHVGLGMPIIAKKKEKSRLYDIVSFSLFMLSLFEL